MKYVKGRRSYSMTINNNTTAGSAYCDCRTVSIVYCYVIFQGMNLYLELYYANID